MFKINYGKIVNYCSVTGCLVADPGMTSYASSYITGTSIVFDGGSTVPENPGAGWTPCTAWGLHPAGGGMQAGFIASRDDMTYLREFKELVLGLTQTVVDGEYGFGQILIKRTHYAMREKGKEFTGTGTNLWMVPAAVYMALMGPEGGLTGTI